MDSGRPGAGEEKHPWQREEHLQLAKVGWSLRAGETKRMEGDEGPMGLEVLPGSRQPVGQVQNSGLFP